MTVPRRQLGQDGPSLSRITYGSMRLGPDIGSEGAAQHLCRLHDLGIDTHHSSHEYDSHRLYLRAMTRALRSGRRFRHIVKLAEPGFDHHQFAPSRLTQLLDDRLQELKADTIDSVQWLFRTPEPGDDATRVATLTEQADDVASWAAGQIESGKMRNLSFFPYSSSFAETVMALGLSKTPAMYLNLVERESIPLLDSSDGFIAIRPLAGGQLVNAADALRFVLLHPDVTTSVISVNSAAHVEELMAVAGTEPDREAFDAALTRSG